MDQEKIIIPWKGENNWIRAFRTKDNLTHFGGMESGTFKTACGSPIGEFITGQDITLSCPVCIQRVKVEINVN